MRWGGKRLATPAKATVPSRRVGRHDADETGHDPDAGKRASPPRAYVEWQRPVRQTHKVAQDTIIAACRCQTTQSDKLSADSKGEA